MSVVGAAVRWRRTVVGEVSDRRRDRRGQCDRRGVARLATRPAWAVQSATRSAWCGAVDGVGVVRINLCNHLHPEHIKLK